MNAFNLLLPVLLPLVLAFAPVRQMPRLKNALPAMAAAACLFLMAMFVGEGVVLSVPWTGAFEFKLRLTLSRWLFLFLLYALSLPPLLYHAATCGGRRDGIATSGLLAGLSLSAILIMAGNPATFTLAWLLSGVNYFLLTVRDASVPAQAAGLRLILVHSFAGLLAGAGLLMSSNATADMLIYGWTEVYAARAQLVAPGLMLTAVLIKAGIFPFNGWAHEAAQYLPPAGPALCFGVWDKIAAAVLMLKAFSDEVPLSAVQGGVVGIVCAGAVLLCGGAAFFETRVKKIAFHVSACGAALIALSCAGDAAGFRFSCAAAAMVVAAGSAAMLLAAAELEKSGSVTDCASAAGAFKAQPFAAVIFAAGGISVSGLVPFALFYPASLIIAGMPVYFAPVALAVMAGQALGFASVVKVFFSMSKPAAEGGGAQLPHTAAAVKGVFALACAALAGLWLGVPVAVRFLLPELSVFGGGNEAVIWRVAIVTGCSLLACWCGYKAGRSAGEKPYLGLYGSISSNPRWNRVINMAGNESFYLYPGVMHVLFSVGRLLSSADRLAGFLTGAVPAYCTELVAVVMSRLNRGQYERRFSYLLAGMAVFLIIAIMEGAK
ncbi:MAG: proton-conducting transporter membrane subunit [Elusimicrobiaceae bacterium]|nr:proton-conducting transporter membrane subunit [Elusimicrobiaceae bacterium]